MVQEDEWQSTIKALSERFQFDYLKDLFLEKSKIYGDTMNKYVAAKSHHHNYIGGLKQHTYEMLRSFQALLETGLYNSIIVDYVAIAVLYHDLAKVYEYNTQTVKLFKDSAEESLIITTTDYIKLVGHLYGSTRILEQDLDKIKDKCNMEQRTLIMHCIISHHGRIEWGAIKEPQTPEAHMVHQLDMLSSQCAKN